MKDSFINVSIYIHIFFFSKYPPATLVELIYSCYKISKFAKTMNSLWIYSYMEMNCELAHTDINPFPNM